MTNTLAWGTALLTSPIAAVEKSKPTSIGAANCTDVAKIPADTVSRIV